jgi:hypothetical protein
MTPAGGPRPQKSQPRNGAGEIFITVPAEIARATVSAANRVGRVRLTAEMSAVLAIREIKPRRQDWLAEGEELDSNILSQEFAPVRRPWWGGGNHNEKAAKYLKKFAEAGAAKALSGNTSGSNDLLLNEQRTQFARLEYFSSW